MFVNIEKLFVDFRIDHSTTHHHCSPGWVNTHCPFCAGSSNYHLGVYPQTGQTNCWRCGPHSLTDVLKKLLRINEVQINLVLKQYITEKAPKQSKIKERKGTIRTQLKQTLLPPGTGELQEVHKKYLQERNFDPDYLINTYGIKGTGPLGTYKFRIMIPIIYDNKLVSYQGRDITGRSESKYKTCNKKLEMKFHKDCLYGENLLPVNYNGNIVVVEGVTDQWRLGLGSVATFGIMWSLNQLDLLTKYKKIFVLFDKGGDADKQANKLADMLAFVGKDVERVTLEDTDATDPGSLSESEADNIMQELLGRDYQVIKNSRR